ncbi:MAG: glycosyltransferase family 4 protein [Cytophagales bacterium]|nr:glycosyltransferase family 4 protein [Cytophagales bacterium]
MTVHLVSETEFGVKGMGIHTAHLDLINLFEYRHEVKYRVNGEGRGDVFHAHTYGLYYFIKGFRYRHRRVHTVHTLPDTLKGSIPFYRLVRPLANAYFKMVFNFADVCIAISPTVEERLKQMNVKSKIVRINNPINPSKWTFSSENRKNGRHFLKIGDDKKVILGVGQIQGRKGVEDFIELAHRMPEYEFVWVGGRPFGKLTEGIKRINNLIRKAPSNIQFTGIIELDKMPQMYAAADIFIFPSFQENSPLAPIEAAASNLPVVFRGLEEYSKLYKGQFLFADTITDFINHIKMLVSNVEFMHLAKTYSKNLVNEFDRNTIHDQLAEIYSELVLKRT